MGWRFGSVRGLRFDSVQTMHERTTRTVLCRILWHVVWFEVKLFCCIVYVIGFG